MTHSKACCNCDQPATEHYSGYECCLSCKTRASLPWYLRDSAAATVPSEDRDQEDRDSEDHRAQDHVPVQDLASP